jgi:hypothetical protein
MYLLDEQWNTLMQDLDLLTCVNSYFRSQLGNRDSEIAMMIEDTDTVPSKMNGKDVSIHH